MHVKSPDREDISNLLDEVPVFEVDGLDVVNEPERYNKNNKYLIV